MTTLTKTDEISIIKTDEVGRRQTPAARRERLLDEFERSGLSAAKFTALTGLKYSTFAAWVHRRRKQPSSAAKVPAKSADPVRWLEAVVAPASTAGEPIAAVVVLLLPGGVRLEVAAERQAALAAMLVRALTLTVHQPKERFYQVKPPAMLRRGTHLKRLIYGFPAMIATT